jgi:hypothetical protein
LIRDKLTALMSPAAVRSGVGLLSTFCMDLAVSFGKLGFIGRSYVWPASSPTLKIKIFVGEPTPAGEMPGKSHLRQVGRENISQ